MSRTLTAEVDLVRALARGEHALDDDTGGDAERLSQLAGLRALRHLARPLLLVRVGDVPDALARDRRELRAGFEHEHARVGESLDEHACVGRADGAAADDGEGGMR